MSTATGAPRPLLFSTRRRRAVANATCGVMTGAACLAGASLAPEGYQVLTAGGGAFLVAGSAGWGHLSWRALHRREVLASLRRAIAPQAGAGAKVTARGRWSSRWGGMPRVVKIRYDTAARAGDPAWLEQLLESCSRILGERVRVVEHDATHGVLVVGVVDPASILPEPELDPQVERVRKMLTDLIGPTAELGEFEADEDGTPVRFTATHEVPAKLAARGCRTRIERTVSEVNPGRWRAQWDQENDRVTFELMPSFPVKVDNPGHRKDIPDSDALLAAYDDVRIPFGVDADGEQVFWRPAKEPHKMVVGKTGTGKSVLQHTLLTEITSYGWPVWVVDGKGVEFLGFREWPNVQIVGTKVPVQVAILERAWQLMEHRYELITQGRARETQFEPLVVFVDEWADFRANLMGWYEGVKQKGDPRKPLVLDRLGSIARKGRTARVHLVFGTQRPDAEYFGADMRDNFPMRTSLGRLSPQAAQMVWENPVTGVTVPRSCRGRATAVNPAGEPVEVQTYWTPDPRKVLDEDSDDAQILDRLRPAEVLQPRLVVELPVGEESWDEKTGEPVTIEPSYADFAHARWHLAENRPDLDDAANADDAASGREAASPMALLMGMRSHAPASASGGSPSAPARTPEPSEAPQVDDDVDLATQGESDGYESITEVAVGELEIGTLIRVDEAAGGWAVLDEEPTEDPMDDTSLVLCWRDDADEAGSLVVDADDVVEARLPVADLAEAA